MSRHQLWNNALDVSQHRFWFSKMASPEAKAPAVFVETITDGVDVNGDEGQMTIVVPGGERFEIENRKDNMLDTLRKMGGLTPKVTVGENKGKVRLRSTQELRDMIEKKKKDAKQSPIPEEAEDSDTQGKENLDGNDDYPWRRFSNEGTRRHRLRSNSDEGVPLLRTSFPADDYGGGSSRRLRSRRRRMYAKDNGLEFTAEDEEEDQDVDIHASRVRRGSIMIPAMTPLTRNRGRYRKGSQDLAIEEENAFGDDESDIGGKRGSRSQLLTSTIMKKDQEAQKRRSRSRRTSLMPQSEQGKLQPPRGRLLSLPGSSRRSRRGSVSDVEDDEDDDDDDDGIGRLNKRGGFLSTGNSNEIQKTNKELKEGIRRRNRVRTLP